MPNLNPSAAGGRARLLLGLALSLLALMLVTGRGHAEPNANSAALRTAIADVQKSQASKLPAGVFESLAYQLDVADRIERDFAPQAEAWRARGQRLIDTAKAGRDPFVEARGKTLMRGSSSPISRIRQGYGIYLPKDYDPARSYPLMIVLHGGSANGNLFLGVVLGNNMNWKEYDAHLWDEFEPRWTPDWIVVAPDGFGQVMWRFMGEQDVLDVIDDVEKHYNVDKDRVVLSGLSNGGVGAYSLGMRHASRFSAVVAIAGAPSWLQYAGGKVDALQAEALHPLSAMSLAENAIDTDFRYHHGHVDPGPMRPAYVEEFTRRISTLGVPYKEKWYDAGHDLLYLVHRHGLIYGELEKITRVKQPKEVRVVTGDYRASRQHWVNVTRIERYPTLARVRAVVDGTRVRVETSNTSAIELALDEAPLAHDGNASVEIDGQVIYDGKRAALASKLALSKDAGRWRIGTPSTSNGVLDKKLGSSGPITDAYFGAMVHVYGSAVPADTAALRKAAERGARGSVLWLWRLEQRVLADTEVTDEIMRNNHLVLYGTPGSNSVLERIKAQLPIRVESDAVVVGQERYSGAGVGTKFIYPNPLATNHYVIVQAAPTTDGVARGQELPDFLPDFVVYDAVTTQVRPRLLFDDRRAPLVLGYFDAHWRLDATHMRAPARRTTKAAARAALPAAKSTKKAVAAPAINDGNDPESAKHDRPRSSLPVTPAPPLPAVPTAFSTEPNTPAGKAAREIARRVQKFTNYRSRIPGATWSLDEKASWSIREDAVCLKQLEELGVHAKPWTAPLSTPVAVPVHVDAPVDGVTFRFMHAAAGGVISCELATRLPDIARVVKAHGVHTVWVLSAYRDHPYPSFHTLGLALDIARFDTDQGALVVKTDFAMDRSQPTCGGTEPSTDKARTLRSIACELANTHRFSSVLTPNYNAGHRDHFHVDTRPDDTRLFLR